MTLFLLPFGRPGPPRRRFAFCFWRVEVRFEAAFLEVFFVADLNFFPIILFEDCFFG